MPFHYYGKYYRSDKKEFFDGDDHGHRNTSHLPYELQRWKKETLQEPRRFLLEKAAEHRVLSDRYQSLHTYLTYLMGLYKPALEEEIEKRRNKLIADITDTRKYNFSKYEGRI